jgi:hypothetical protein
MSDDGMGDSAGAQNHMVVRGKWAASHITSRFAGGLNRTDLNGTKLRRLTFGGKELLQLGAWSFRQIVLLVPAFSCAWFLSVRSVRIVPSPSQSRSLDCRRRNSVGSCGARIPGGGRSPRSLKRAECQGGTCKRPDRSLHFRPKPGRRSRLDFQRAIKRAPLRSRHSGITRTQSGDCSRRRRLEHLCSFRRLEDLSIVNCGASPDLIADFSGFRHLRQLVLAKVPLPPRDIGTLEKLPELRELVLIYDTGLDSWLAAVSKVRSIRKLTVQGDVSDQGLAEIGKMVGLEELTLEGDRYSCDGIRALSSLQLLGALGLSGTNLGDDCLKYATSLKRLRNLSVVAVEGLSDAGVQHLHGPAKLEQLRLAGMGITSRSAATLVKISTLTHLVLDGTEIDDVGLRELSGLHGLMFLSLANSKVSDIKTDLTFPKLQFLSLEGTALTDDGLRHITRLPQLSSLNISNTRVTKAAIEMLAGMPSLLTVYAYGSEIDQESPEWLALEGELERRRELQASTVPISP